MHTKSPTVTNVRLNSLDLLRGLAIIGVIAVHAVIAFPSGTDLVDSLLGFGRFGVQLFYFISALTMCHMWELRGGEENPIRKFYIRRFLRIAPLFWIAIPVYLYINGADISYYAPEGIGVLEILLTATFLHGFWPSSINSVVPGGWSIAVEMTFYALFPLIILKAKSRAKIYLYLALLIFFLNSFIFKPLISDFLHLVYKTNSQTIIEEYLNLSFLNQAPIFMLGCSIYFSLKKRFNYQILILLLFWVSASFFLRNYFGIKQFLFVLVYLFIGLVVYAAVFFNFSFRPLELIGKKAYAMYLTHFLVLTYLQKISRTYLSYEPGFVSYLLGFCLAIFVSYILSSFLYILIEHRVHKFAQSITRSD